jgi:NAD(P)-dependent dehydrogenase (short-subunit alcohol dehydrogenase family)
MNLNNCTAFVTGGASGLGEAVSRLLAGAGARVAVLDTNTARGSDVAADIGGLFCELDVTQEASVDWAFAAARSVLGQERVLVNCAGTASAARTASRDRSSGAVKHFPLATFDRTIQVNLVGTFRCVAKSAAGMLTAPPLDDGERGVIINTSSVAAEDGQAGQAAYAASKAGIVGMTLPIARDLMNEGIRVNTVLPGIFDTPMMRGFPDSVRSALAANVPFPKRLGSPDEFASLIVEICRNGYLNGACIRLDGALRMAAN